MNVHFHKNYILQFLQYLFYIFQILILLFLLYSVALFFVGRTLSQTDLSFYLAHCIVNLAEVIYCKFLFSILFFIFLVEKLGGFNHFQSGLRRLHVHSHIFWLKLRHFSKAILFTGDSFRWRKVFSIGNRRMHS